MSTLDHDSVERALRAASDLSEQQIQRLVAEARAEAEAEVKTLLKSAIKASLLERALAHLGNAESAPQIATPRQEALTASYVYCITNADHPLPQHVQPIDPECPIRAVRHDTVQAIVSDVLYDEFGQEALDQHVTDAKWVERTVRAHDLVVKASLVGGPIVPLRFCVVLRDNEAVRQVLEVHQQSLVQALASVKGTTEWGVKVTWRAPESSEDTASGRDYLLQKQARLQGTDKRAATERAQELHERLTAIARQSVLLPTQRHASENGRSLLLNGAYLVADTVQRQFHKAAAAFSDKWAPEGLTCEVTGPWPPYNFVNLDLSLQPAQ